jgi:peptide/nickel transport system permease protein
MTVGGVRRQAGSRPRLIARLLADSRARVAGVTLLVVIGVAVFAQQLAPYDPSAQLDIVRLHSKPPSLAHPLGTDTVSRDVLSRLIWGTRLSLSIAFTAVGLSVTIGILLGALAGYAGGVVDAVLMRLVDAALSIPRLLLLIVVIALWGDVGVVPLTFLIASISWFSVSRLVRAETLAVRDHDYVVAARALGASPARVLLRHVLPNVAGPGLVSATLSIGSIVLLEAGLSYLGIGVPQPAPSWGNIIQDGADRVADLWWLTLFPGLAILVTVFACNALGDALRDAMDPRQLAATLGDDTPFRTR